MAADASIGDTDREAIIRARRGQGLVKQRCDGNRRDLSNDERLDGENGLLLTPSIDHLFDRVFIGFEDSGNLSVSPVPSFRNPWNSLPETFGRAAAPAWRASLKKSPPTTRCDCRD